MAKAVKKKKGKQGIVDPFGINLGRSNYYILIAGLIIITVGFLLMTQGPWDNPLSLSVSPVVLLIAYLVVIPIAILYKKKDKEESDTSQS